jgi:hypothetical protein
LKPPLTIYIIEQKNNATAQRPEILTEVYSMKKKSLPSIPTMLIRTIVIKQYALIADLCDTALLVFKPVRRLANQHPAQSGAMNSYRDLKNPSISPLPMIWEDHYADTIGFTP